MTEHLRVQVQFDGAAQGGRAGWGFAVHGGGLDHEECGAIRTGAEEATGGATNNVAEYTGAIRALEYLRSRGYRGPVLVSGDSQLVIRQFNGEYAVRAPHLAELLERLKALAREFEEATFEWVPRELNRQADALSKEGLHRS